MTENGDPLENAIAERVNGILKDEYLSDYSIETINDAKEVLEFAVKLYNQDRPHNSFSNFCPDQVYELNLSTERLWKNYYKKNSTIVNQLQD